MRKVGILTLSLGSVVLLGAASPLRAQLACGGTVGPGGTLVLTEDLDCRNAPQCQTPGACNPALTIVGKTVLDLAGHTITCDSGFDDGVLLTGTGATLRNGNVNICGTGVRLAPPGRHVVRNVVASRSGANGFTIDDSSGNRLERNVADTSANSGFNSTGAASDNKLVGNLATRTARFNGFNISGSGERNQLRDNVAVANASDGFNVQTDASSVVGNSAVGNGGVGFNVGGDGNRVARNRAASNDSGFDADGEDNAFQGNTALDNATIDMEEGLVCDNTWRRNVFRTSDLPGCIQ
jgi:parallel beta-helix repeat protein